MIQIYGAGMSGTYFAKLCENEGVKYKIYDIRDKPDCRCAWGIENIAKFKKLLSDIDYKLDEYVLSKCKKVITNYGTLRKKVITIDKAKLLSDLWNELEINKPEDQNEEIIVDATGYRRAILPPIKNDVLVPCVQIRCKSNLDENIYIFIDGIKGYAWAFPVGEEWHIGAGHIDGIDKANELVKKLIRYFKVKIGNVKCKCRGRVRHLPPSKCKPIYFYNGRNIFGIGESVGAVTFIGAGNVTTLESAKVLIDVLLNEDDYYTYDDRIIKTFKSIETSYKLVESVNKKNVIDALKLSYEKVKNREITPLDLLSVSSSIIKKKFGGGIFGKGKI